MEMRCKTCLAWFGYENHEDGECRLHPDTQDAPRQAWCLDWTPREIGTCGDCRFGRFPDMRNVGCCGKSAVVFIAPEKVNFTAKDTPGCGDWRPKKEAAE